MAKTTYFEISPLFKANMSQCVPNVSTPHASVWCGYNFVSVVLWPSLKAQAICP